MSQSRKLAGTTHHDPITQRGIDLQKAEEVRRVKAALEKPDARRVLLAKHEERRGQR